MIGNTAEGAMMMESITWDANNTLHCEWARLHGVVFGNHQAVTNLITQYDVEHPVNAVLQQVVKTQAAKLAYLDGLHRQVVVTPDREEEFLTLFTVGADQGLREVNGLGVTMALRMMQMHP